MKTRQPLSSLRHTRAPAVLQTLCEALAALALARCEVFLVWIRTSQLPVVSTSRIYDLWLVVGKDLGQLLEAFAVIRQVVGLLADVRVAQ